MVKTCHRKQSLVLYQDSKRKLSANQHLRNFKGNG